MGCLNFINKVINTIRLLHTRKKLIIYIYIYIYIFVEKHMVQLIYRFTPNYNVRQKKTHMLKEEE